MTVLEALNKRLQPKYTGYMDQYKAVLTALGIPLDMPIKDLDALMDLWYDGEV